MNSYCIVPAQWAATAWRDLLPKIESIRLLALCTRRTDDVEESSFRQRLRTDIWEIPIVEITWRR